MDGYGSCTLLGRLWFECLSAGGRGFLLARSVGTLRLDQHVDHERRLKASLQKVMAEHQTVRQEVTRLQAALEAAQQDATTAEHRSMPAEASDQGAFGEDEQTALPDPVAFFHSQAKQAEEKHSSVPSLKQVSDDEFEIPAAAAQSDGELGSVGGYADSHDATKQFKLHSPEAVVHFLQRIDELSDENRELKAALDDHEATIKGQKAEGSEHVQRFAALDATVDKLRQELKRRTARIKQLEERLDQELRAGAKAPPPPSPLAKAIARGSPTNARRTPSSTRRRCRCPGSTKRT